MFGKPRLDQATVFVLVLKLVGVGHVLEERSSANRGLHRSDLNDFINEEFEVVVGVFGHGCSFYAAHLKGLVASVMGRGIVCDWSARL